MTQERSTFIAEAFLRVARAAAWAHLAIALSLTSPASAGALRVTEAAAFSGTYGLELSVGSNCTADTDLSLGPGAISGSFQACRTITATEVDVVAPGALLLAGRRVEMSNSSSVTSGALEVELDSSLYPFAYLRDDSPGSDDNYDAAFALRLDNLTLGPNNDLEHLTGRSSDDAKHFEVTIQRIGGQNAVRLAARLDTGAIVQSGAGEQIVLPAGWNELEVSFVAGPGTGQLLVTLNGVGQGGLTGLANAGARIDSVEWGAVDGDVTGTSGWIEMDEFVSMR